MESIINPLVCFYDSGIGGLNLLCESVRILPQTDFIYFADNYRVPYGALSKNELLKISDEVFQKMNDLNPSAAVIACNTLTAQCIESLREKYPFEIIGIQPAIKSAAAVKGKILVLATPATAESDSLKNLTERDGESRTTFMACPDLASYLEKNVENLSQEEVKKLLPKIEADAVVLGCTHYIFATDVIKDYYNCPVFDGIQGTATNLRKKLGISDHLTPRAQKITFSGGDINKNREIFRILIKRTNALTLF